MSERPCTSVLLFILLVFALFGTLFGCYVARQRRREKERELLSKQTSPGAPGMPPRPSAPERPTAERRTFSVAEERSAVKIQAIARGRMERVEKLVFELSSPFPLQTKKRAEKNQLF